MWSNRRERVAVCESESWEGSYEGVSVKRLKGTWQSEQGGLEPQQKVGFARRFSSCFDYPISIVWMRSRNSNLVLVFIVCLSIVLYYKIESG